MIDINVANFITVGLMAILFFLVVKFILKKVKPDFDLLWGEKMINTKLFNIHDFLVIGIFSLLWIMLLKYFVKLFNIEELK